MIRRSYHPSLVISAPAPIAHSASPHPENMAIPPWTDKTSNGVNTPMRAMSTSLLRPGPPRELNVVFHILKWGSNGCLRSMASSGVELKVRGKQCVFAWGIRYRRKKTPSKKKPSSRLLISPGQHLRSARLVSTAMPSTYLTTPRPGFPLHHSL